ncbi:MAG: Isochorismatase [Planctomycetaceae bacterium]|nr:Isochorismatase [Planctomycetaceae bacterium]
MSEPNRDLHGNAPDKSNVVLLVIDMINDLDFPEGPELLRFALPAARRIATLKQRAREVNIPTIFVNDNFGRWRSNFNTQIDHCLKENSLGRPLVQELRPQEDDYFVLKPKHSGFFSTTLDTLLDYLEAKIVIITGIATNICVLFTANDAYMRDFQIFVPHDCVAANTEDENLHALDQMHRRLKADILPSTELSLTQLSTEINCRPRIQESQY